MTVAAREIDPTKTKMPEADRLFRHIHWQEQRTLVRKALESAGTSYKILDRFDTCGSHAQVYYQPSEDRYVIRASYCRNRHCQPCAAAKAGVMASNLRRKLNGPPRGRYRFTTLTLKHNTRPLAEQLARLMTSWTKLRKSKLFKTQFGGAWFLEVKIGEDDLWHPHLHIISEGFFLPLQELTALWLKITGDSTGVDVRGVRDKDRVSYELTKYVAKSTSRDVWEDPERAVEWICAARGVRSCGTFGIWRRFKLTETPPPPKDLVYIGSLYDLTKRMREGEPEAQHIMLCMLSGRPPPVFLDSSIPLPV